MKARVQTCEEHQRRAAWHCAVCPRNLCEQGAAMLALPTDGSSPAPRCAFCGALVTAIRIPITPRAPARMLSPFVGAFFQMPNIRNFVAASAMVAIVSLLASKAHPQSGGSSITLAFWLICQLLIYLIYLGFLVPLAQSAAHGRLLMPGASRETYEALRRPVGRLFLYTSWAWLVATLPPQQPGAGVWLYMVLVLAIVLFVPAQVMVLISSKDPQNGHAASVWGLIQKLRRQYWGSALLASAFAYLAVLFGGALSLRYEGWWGAAVAPSATLFWLSWSAFIIGWRLYASYERFDLLSEEERSECQMPEATPKGVLPAHLRAVAPEDAQTPVVRDYSINLEPGDLKNPAKTVQVETLSGLELDTEARRFEVGNAGAETAESLPYAPPSSKPIAVDQEPADESLLEIDLEAGEFK